MGKLIVKWLVEEIGLKFLSQDPSIQAGADCYVGATVVGGALPSWEFRAETDKSFSQGSKEYWSPESPTLGPLPTQSTYLPQLLLLRENSQQQEKREEMSQISTVLSWI